MKAESPGHCNLAALVTVPSQEASAATRKHTEEAEPPEMTDLSPEEMPEPLPQSLRDRVIAAVGNDNAPLVSAVWGSSEPTPELDAVLRGEAGAPAAPHARFATTAARSIWLNKLEVSGFRGAGSGVATSSEPFPPLSISLPSRPDLVVITGRNGAGKSSLVDGLEWCFTGAVARISDLPRSFKDAQKNRHVPTDEAVTVSLTVDGVESIVTRSAMSAGRNPAIEALFALHRPILTPVELRRVQGKPIDLYAAFASGLGLDELSDAVDALMSAQEQRRRDASRHDARREACALGLETRASTDALGDALREIASAIRVADDAAPALARIDQLVADGPPSVETIRRPLAWPSPEAIGQLRAKLQDTLIATRSATNAVLDAGGDLVDVLRPALIWSESRDLPTACPVCGEGTLDHVWRESKSAEIERFSALVEARRQAAQQSVSAEQAVRNLVPGNIASVAEGMTGLPDTMDAVLLFGKECSSLDSTAILDRLAGLGPQVLAWNQSLEALLSSAAKLRHGLVADASSWLHGLNEANRKRAEADQVEITADSLKAALTSEIASVFGPLEDLTQALWAMLAPDSGIDLTSVEIKPGKQKRVEPTLRLAAPRNGGKRPSQKGLGFLSGGQLQVIALCLFLARATRASSPFRFIVIDDPVQSLDELRIENFVRVLAGIAEGNLQVDPTDPATAITFPARQVVVMTHDDRVRKCIHRLGITAALKSIERTSTSIVTITADADPVDRKLEEARLIVDSGAPKWIKLRSVAALCRSAVEATAFPAFAQLCDTSLDAEIAWDELDETKRRLAKAAGSKDKDMSGYESSVRALVTDLNSASHADSATTLDPNLLRKRTEAALPKIRTALSL